MAEDNRNENNNNEMPRKQGNEDAKRNSGRKYTKNLTVMVVVEGEDITTMDVLEVVKKECGMVVGCRVREVGRLEMTMETENGKKKLKDGIKYRNSLIMGRELNTNEMVVSLLNLPLYIESRSEGGCSLSKH